ncbi:MAG TPA: hypothetical protein DIT97_22730, partial [Gimesia maris]|nr:hypothetical protein [Gimesia maris]
MEDTKTSDYFNRISLTPEVHYRKSNSFDLQTEEGNRMASPLELFRKKQKVLMVPLTILALFAFIVMDQLTPAQFPPIAGMLFFGFVFWY